MLKRYLSILPGAVGIVLCATIPVSAAAFTGTFSDPLTSLLNPNSILTGNFSFDSTSIASQGFVASSDITFSGLETSNGSSGFNGTGWSFFPANSFPATSFVFNTQKSLFEGTYEIKRDCLPGEGCPPNTLGQAIFNPPNPNIVAWDPAPGQVVVITSGNELPPVTNPQPTSVPEPAAILGIIFTAGFGLASKQNQKAA